MTEYNYKIGPSDVGKAFFTSSSSWMTKLLAFRNQIVLIFGLKTSKKSKDGQQLENFKCQQNERLGLFKVFDLTENEVILGEDDKHLDFRISLHLEDLISKPTKKKITITTTVTFNNWFGKLYFIPVKPFHKLIVPTMLKGIIRELERL